MDTERASVGQQKILAAEHKVELQSTALKKELRLIDLIGMQILNIVGFAWVGTAGKLGSSHIVYWLSAVLVFYIPSGIVVAYLVKEMPLEGGLYQWAKLRFSPFIGFLVAMNIWFYNLLVISRVGLIVADNIAYALGPKAAWISSSKSSIVAISAFAICGLMLVAWRGLALGKWVNDFGGFAIVFLFVSMIAAALPHWFHGTVAMAPVAFTVPGLSLLNLNLLGKMGFGAFGGFDGVGIFAGECQGADAAAPIRRSVWLAAPIISAMFIVGTASVLTFSRPASIDLVSPMMQVLGAGAPQFVGSAALLLVAALLAQNSLGFSSMIRLPMVAGWDHLLPAWFSRLDLRYRTPLGSVLFAGVIGLMFAILANLGAGNQEAFQLLDNAGGILYALAYLVMFAIPLLGKAIGAGEKPAWGVRAAALSGFLMTLLYAVLSIFPIIDIENPWRFTSKIVVIVGGLQCAGAAYYRWATRNNLG